MEAIITRPAAGATSTRPASPRQGGKPVRSAVARPPAATPSSSATDWRLLVRPYLDETHDILLAATHPAEGPMPLGLPTELATHSVVALRELLSEDDASAEWQDDITTLCALQWARSSMLAAVALLGTADDESRSAADTYRVVSRRLSSACAALELTHDLTAMSHELQQGIVKTFRDQQRPPIRRAPTAVEMDSLAHEAERIGLLVEWCIGAHATLEDLSVTAEMFPALKTMLLDRDIRYTSPDWLQCRIDECLAELLQRQSLLIKQMAGRAA